MTTDSLYIRHRRFLGISVSFVLAFLTTPMLVHAQMDVATYNKERHQLINYHTNSQGNLESISIVDDDMTTIMLNVDGTTRSIVNSLATMEFEFDDTELDANYTVDGQRLSRCVYHIDQDVDFKKFKQEYLMYKGELNTLDKMDKFLSQGGAQLIYDATKHTLDMMSNPIQTCYGVLTKNPYEKEKTEIISADNIAEIVAGESSVMDKMKEFTIGYIFEHYNDWTADWASTVYKWMVKHYERQKNLNEQVQEWRQGIKEKVLRNEITIAEATEQIAKIEKERQSYKKIYAGFGQDVAVTITEKDGQEEVTYKVVDKDGRPAEERNAPAKGESSTVMRIVNEFSNRYKYGTLDHIAITYYTPSNGHEDWSYGLEKGKLVLKDHTDVEGDGKREHPHYRVWLDYSNDVNPKVWGSVQVQLWLSPGGNILNSYIIDCRGTQADYMNGKLPRKTRGDQFYFFPDSD
ncbi:transforming acidic coiled-coil-containing protein [Prevotella sp. E2-28]|uniref:transforming acidic coiled-coil-containing protein n=1 Tax=Prevotella sp. E2-28 TaxID=2913620 RepID=UPI001EDB835A|nr:transforming acidic coiled-coil-containing protein [Prevotella sp. E2-28]UKK53169.1 transforming acidic coiled-coil-containing protein [Prevotella sp. E2-28]